MYFSKFELSGKIYGGSLSEIYKCVPKLNSCDIQDYKFRRSILFKRFINNGSFEYSFERNPYMISVSHLIPGVRKLYGGIRDAELIININRLKVKEDGILMEYVDGINLRNYLINFTMSVSQIFSFIKQMLRILSKLHEMSIMHRDLKLDNILILTNINKKVKITLIDFSLSTNMCISDKKVGTPLYSAPELIKNRNYNNKIDMYSFGLILYEVIQKKHIYYDTMRNKLIGKDEHLDILSRGFEDKLKKKCTSYMWDAYPIFYKLLKKCLKVNPADRISSKDAYDIFKNYD